MTSRFPPFAFVELVSPYNKKNITRWLKDMNFMFSWQEQYLTRSLRSLVRYCSCHSNIKFISCRHRMKGTSVHIKDTWTNQLCNHKVRDLQWLSGPKSFQGFTTNSLPMSPRSNRKPVLGQRSTFKQKTREWARSFFPLPLFIFPRFPQHLYAPATQVTGEW